MKKTIILLVLMCICMTAMAKQGKTVTLRIVETSDVHGAFFPYNFTERRPMEGTMALDLNKLQLFDKETEQSLLWKEW